MTEACSVDFFEFFIRYFFHERDIVEEIGVFVVVHGTVLPDNLGKQTTWRTSFNNFGQFGLIGRMNGNAMFWRSPMVVKSNVRRVVS